MRKTRNNRHAQKDTMDPMQQLGPIRGMRPSDTLFCIHLLMMGLRQFDYLKTPRWTVRMPRDVAMDVLPLWLSRVFTAITAWQIANYPDTLVGQDQITDDESLFFERTGNSIMMKWTSGGIKALGLFYKKIHKALFGKRNGKCILVLDRFANKISSFVVFTLADDDTRLFTSMTPRFAGFLNLGIGKFPQLFAMCGGSSDMNDLLSDACFPIVRQCYRIFMDHCGEIKECDCFTGEGGSGGCDSGNDQLSSYYEGHFHRMEEWAPWGGGGMRKKIEVCSFWIGEEVDIKPEDVEKIIISEMEEAYHLTQWDYRHAKDFKEEVCLRTDIVDAGYTVHFPKDLWNVLVTRDVEKQMMHVNLELCAEAYS